MSIESELKLWVYNMEELRNESYKEYAVRNSNINFLNRKAVWGQVEGREKTYARSKFKWVSRLLARNKIKFSREKVNMANL
mgnify:CR=1 FL=1